MDPLGLHDDIHKKPLEDILSIRPRTLKAPVLFQNLKGAFKRNPTPQRAQDPLIKEYSLNHNMNPLRDL